MEFPLYILAGLGILAVTRRLLGAVVRALRGGVEAYLAREVARTRASRGDLTGMEEAYGTAAEARRVRWKALGAAVAWTVLLALPVALLETAAPVYATYVAVWILPRLHRPTSVGSSPKGP